MPPPPLPSLLWAELNQNYRDSFHHIRAIEMLVFTIIFNDGKKKKLVQTNKIKLLELYVQFYIIRCHCTNDRLYRNDFQDLSNKNKRNAKQLWRDDENEIKHDLIADSWKIQKLFLLLLNNIWRMRCALVIITRTTHKISIRNKSNSQNGQKKKSLAITHKW